MLGSQTGGRFLLAYAYNYADAVTGSSYGAQTGIPILLSNISAEADGSLYPATQRIFDDHAIASTDLLGGPGVLDDSVLAAVPGQRRIAGSNRMGTAVEIARQLWQPVLGRHPSLYATTRRSSPRLARLQ